MWSLAGSLVQPIFNAGRISAQVDAATARREQVEVLYVQTVQSSSSATRTNALIAHRSSRESYVLQEERAEQFARALTLADPRYRSGYAQLHRDVLDTQRNLLEAQRQRVLALRERQVALVDLYKALGGGWSPEQFAQAQ